MVTRAAGKCCGGPVNEKSHAVPGGIHGCGKNWGKRPRHAGARSLRLQGRDGVERRFYRAQRGPLEPVIDIAQGP